MQNIVFSYVICVASIYIYIIENQIESHKVRKLCIKYLNTVYFQSLIQIFEKINMDKNNIKKNLVKKKNIKVKYKKKNN